MPLSFTTKSKKSITLRPPVSTDARQLMIFINSLVAEDALILFNQKQTLAKEKAYLKDTLIKIRLKQRAHLLAFHQNTLIANCQIDKNLYRSSHVGTFGISVQAGFRHEGIGYFLANQVIELAHTKLKINLIKLEVFSPNLPAIKLYQRLGFIKYGRLPKSASYQGQYIDRILMYKQL